MKKILVVDNSEAMRQVICNILQKHGYETCTAIDGLSALDVLETFCPELIFVDWIMPNISGDKLCRIISQDPDFKEIYLVILSAMVNKNIDFKKFGADACIAKGPLLEMEHNILDIISAFESNKKSALSNEIIGLENLYSRQATKELLTLKHHYEISLQNLADGFIEIHQGKITIVNPAAIKILGVPEEKLLSSQLLTHIPSDIQKDVQAALDTIGNRPVYFGEKKPLLINNYYIVFTFVCIPEEKKGSIIVIIRDVTERYIAEQALQKEHDKLEVKVEERTVQLEELQRELLETAHHEGMADIANVIIHNVGNLLTSMTSNCERIGELFLQTEMKNIKEINDLYRDKVKTLDHFIETDKEKTKLILEYLLKFEKSCENNQLSVEALINSLRQGILSISQIIDSQQKYATGYINEERLNLPDIVNDSHALMANTLAMHGVTLKKQFETVPLIIGQKSKLIQICINLLKNSMEAMSGFHVKEKIINISIDSNDKSAFIRFKDRGVGIDQLELKNIFTKGYTTKKKGHGFGLHSCVIFLDDMNGKISAKSIGKHKGSEFTIEFPLPD